MLHPPLESIARRLFGTASPEGELLDSQSAQTHDRYDEVLLGDRWQLTPLPAHILDAIQTRLALQSRATRHARIAGEIIGLDLTRLSKEPRTLGCAVGVLLTEHIRDDLWWGFIAAGERDYATDADLFIEDLDSPIDPSIRFIQAWNRVQISVAAVDRSLGQLSLARCALVECIHQEWEAGLIRPVPSPEIGKVRLRELNSSGSAVTGTALGGVTDSRRLYKAYYRSLGIEVSALSAKSSPLAQGPAKSKRRAWPLLPISGVVCALVASVALYLQSEPLDTIEAQLVRSAPKDVQATKVPTGRLRVMFKPTASYEQVAKAMRDLNLQFISGPDENGEVELATTADRRTEVAAVLRIRGLVDSASPVDSASRTPARRN